MLRKYLEKLAFAVSEAATGKAAMESLQRETPDLICLDLMLPESSGYEICEKIRASAAWRDLPVLVISARSMPSDRAIAEEVGASAYLIKPIRWDSFSATVRSLMDG